MAFNDAMLNQIYDRTSGRCHICHKKLAYKNYGAVGAFVGAYLGASLGHSYDPDK